MACIHGAFNVILLRGTEFLEKIVRQLGLVSYCDSPCVELCNQANNIFRLFEEHSPAVQTIKCACNKVWPGPK